MADKYEKKIVIALEGTIKYDEITDQFYVLVIDKKEGEKEVYLDEVLEQALGSKIKIGTMVAPIEVEETEEDEE